MSKRMKYTIHGFQQKQLLENKLNNDDALVLSVIKDMYSSALIEHVTIDGDRYIWVNQRALQEYIPVIGGEKKVRRMIDNYVKIGVLKKVIKNSKNGQRGSFTFIKPTPLLDTLSELPLNNDVKNGEIIGLDKKSKGVVQKVQEGYPKSPHKDSPIENSPIEDYKHTTAVAVVERVDQDLQSLVERWNAIDGIPDVRVVKKGTTRYKHAVARLKEYGLDEVLRAVSILEASDFLMGRSSSWRATFDWFVNQSNFIKIIEGNYDNRRVENEERGAISRKPYSVQEQERLYREAQRAYHEGGFAEMSDDDTF